MLMYPGDPQAQGNPPQHVALSSLSTSAAPFTVDGPYPAGPTFPNPSFPVPAAPSLNAAGGWGDPSFMEAPARFMAPDAVAAASLGYTGEVFDSAPYSMYFENHFGNFVDSGPLRSESSELISEKCPGTCGESLEALSNGFGLSAHCQQQSASASKLFDGIGAESIGCCYPRPVPNQDPSGSATSLISGAPVVPAKSLTSESVLGTISSQAAKAEKTADTRTLTEEGQEHSHCHPDAEGYMLQMSESISRNQAIFLELMHNLSAVLLSTCNGGSSLQEYEKENLKSIIRNLEAVSSKGGKAVPKLPDDKILDDSEVSQVSIYKKLWIEAEASVCKLKYELQVAHMKLAAKKGHNNIERVPIDPSEGDKAPRLSVSGGKPHSHAKESSTCDGPAPLPPLSDILSPRSILATKKSIIDGVNAAQKKERLARLEVQESCIDNVSSLGENKCEEQKEASKESHAVEGGVLVGPIIFKSCTDNITSLSLESSNHQLDTSTNTTDEVDDAVAEMFARLKVLESRLDTLSSLGENKYEEQQRESEGSYAVDDAVLARLRILKSRADNITSLGLESSKKQRDASTNTSGKIDDAGAEMCTRLEVLEPNLSSLGDDKCEEQQKESKGSYSVGDDVLARLQILKSRADNVISLGLESTDTADEVDDAVVARLGILNSCPDLKASSIGGDVEGEEDTCAVGLQVSSRQPPPSLAAALERTTLLTKPLEVTGETPAILILPSIEVPPLSTLKDAPSVLEKDLTGFADNALPPAPLLSVPQEVGVLTQKVAKGKHLSHGPMPRSFRLPSTIKIKRPISEQGARAILLRKLRMVKDDEVDEEAMDRCLEILEAWFPKSLLQAIFCGSELVKGTPGELWGISASDVVF
uniref:Uncharacterized protein n=1 Tax=Avena sativa TaxID=4498 RepID=A0ACD5TII5_AVESA